MRIMKEPIRILGINPGTRYIGYAVLYGQELMDWGIKVIVGKWREKKINKAIKIISEIIKRYKINAVVIKRLNPVLKTRNLSRMTSRIIYFIKRNKMNVDYYSIKEAERILIAEGKTNKNIMIEKIKMIYPDIIPRIMLKKSYNIQYNNRYFEAIALSLIFLWKMSHNIPS